MNAAPPGIGDLEPHRRELTDYPLAVAGQLAPVRFQIADAYGGTDI